MLGLFLSISILPMTSGTYWRITTRLFLLFWKSLVKSTLTTPNKITLCSVWTCTLEEETNHIELGFEMFLIHKDNLMNMDQGNGFLQCFFGDINSMVLARYCCNNYVVWFLRWLNRKAKCFSCADRFIAFDIIELNIYEDNYFQHRYFNGSHSSAIGVISFEQSNETWDLDISVDCFYTLWQSFVRHCSDFFRASNCNTRFG